MSCVRFIIDCVLVVLCVVCKLLVCVLCSVLFVAHCVLCGGVMCCRNS